MMPPRGIHNPAARSRASLLQHADRSQTGSEFSPLVDAFHPSFPASVKNYISQPSHVNREDSTLGRRGHSNICIDAGPCHDNRFGHNSPCHLNNASTNGLSAEIDCASSAHHCNAEDGTINLLLGTSGSIFNLPPEVSDLILSYLSPAALDAARHTCKDWRANILSNPWVLSSVLGVKEEGSRFDGSLHDRISHRNLLRKLDRDSDLPSTFRHPDAWRTRFRTRNLDFTLPTLSSTRTRPALVAAARTGTQNGWLVFQLQYSAQDIRNRWQSTLVIYRFDSAELPCYAGAVHDVDGKGALCITGVVEIRRDTEWVLKIEIGDTAGLYSLTAREAFSNSDSRFSLGTLKSLERVPGLSKDEIRIHAFDRPPKILPNGSQSWNILVPLPPDGGLRHVCFSEGLRKHTEPRFLAEQRETGNIHIVMEVGPSEKPSQYASYSLSTSLSNQSERGNHYFTGIALLSRPRPNAVYKNVAVAPTIIKDGSIRAAIVWQTAELERQISELYIYDIPEAVYYEPCRAYSQNISNSVSTSAKNIGESEIPRSCDLVQGKRVASLDQHLGGFHPFSPLYRSASPREIAAGGLQFPHTAENQETYPRNVQYQKCFVWGPTSSRSECTQVSLQVFDFSFADPQRLSSLIAYGVGVGWRRDQRFHHIALNSIHCACALHDDGFRIVLPDTTTVEASKPTMLPENADKIASSPLQKNTSLKENLSSLTGTAWSFWPRTPTPASDGSSKIVGTMSCNDSTARRVALERRQEWLRGRIVGMKRVGLTDFEIAELWNISAWTRYGQVRKPEGWRDL